MNRRAELEAALIVAARIMARDGAEIAPLFLRLEAELEKMKSQTDTLARAAAILAAAA